jgi:cbb3-type cytochrome oxidase subunit 3
MAGFIDYIPTIAIILFAVGIIGAIVYERVRTKNIEEPSP